jgi:hypothetical protein
MWAAYAKLRIAIPDIHESLVEGKEVTITKGVNEKYALWHHTGIYDLPEEYIDSTTIRDLNKPITPCFYE